ncbi:hypothetical protein D7D52_12765 [Nocardia yunnanensis]|uniref:Uncharacterized protein n=2 Tax=Nocardia yunnanensis TaxID=2382165 RepID=A0A386ZDN5_9NOCA|nr:hypothetical protein D7D52_12765 [Nocardia yunnanensis]
MTGPRTVPTGYDRLVYRLLWLALDTRAALRRRRKISRPGVDRGRPPVAMNAAAQRFRAPRA